MDIIVCVKQVPDTETQIKINSDGTGIVTDDIKWVMNPYDEFGVEEALRLKEKFGGSVTVVSVGPKKVTETIRTALAMGADKGVMVADDAALNGDGLHRPPRSWPESSRACPATSFSAASGPWTTTAALWALRWRRCWAFPMFPW